ncbi:MULTISPECIES: hypothetical protein [Paraliobacillus]|uniref:hypothetical protein n=1 Tax=Paraliobacillus TaxID=200903 RepID=UPI000DD40978|nr:MULTISPECIES: hypothetical protein [Paraliobacillus]
MNEDVLWSLIENVTKEHIDNLGGNKTVDDAILLLLIQLKRRSSSTEQRLEDKVVNLDVIDQLIEKNRLQFENVLKLIANKKSRTN